MCPVFRVLQEVGELEGAAEQQVQDLDLRRQEGGRCPRNSRHNIPSIMGDAALVLEYSSHASRAKPCLALQTLPPCSLSYQLL